MKTQAELDKLSVEELAAYYNELNEKKTAEMQDLIEKKASKDDIDKLRDEIHTSLNLQAKNLNDMIKNIGLKFEKSLANEKKSVSVKEAIRQHLTDKLDTIKSIKANRTSEKISFKTAQIDTMLESGSITGEIPAAQIVSGLNLIATREPFIQQLINTGAATSNLIRWYEQANITGTAAGTAEGDPKNQMAFELVAATETVKKRTVYIKVSEEMIEDIDFLQTQINNELLRTLTLDIDEQILKGNNVNENLNGIITQATAYAAGSFAGTIEDANIFDVLETALNQVYVANFVPNVIVLHPTDVTKMKLSKSTEGDYLMPPFTSADGMQIEGVRIVKNTGITAGKFLVMDGTRATAYFKKGITIEMGRDGNDFTNNLWTIIAEARLALVIKGNDTPAFVYGDIATAIAAIDKAS